MEKRLVLNVADFRFVEITCGNCEARIVFDAAHRRGMPTRCEACNTMLEEKARDATDSILHAFNLLRPDVKLASKVSVILDEPSE